MSLQHLSNPQINTAERDHTEIKPMQIKQVADSLDNNTQKIDGNQGCVGKHLRQCLLTFFFKGFEMFEVVLCLLLGKNVFQCMCEWHI